MRLLLHICALADWQAAQDGGGYRPPSLDLEGFIHLSTPDQVLIPANRFYHGQTGLVLLVLDGDQLTAPVRFEAAPDAGEMRFPHLHGGLNRDAVRAVIPFPPQTDGTFALPPSLAKTNIVAETSEAKI